MTACKWLAQFYKTQNPPSQHQQHLQQKTQQQMQGGKSMVVNGSGGIQSVVTAGTGGSQYRGNMSKWIRCVPHKQPRKTIRQELQQIRKIIERQKEEGKKVLFILCHF
jgi:hypothetical protein